LTALIFSNSCNFETEGDTTRKQIDRSLKDLAILFRASLAYLPPFQSHESLKKNGAVNTFETASISNANVKGRRKNDAEAGLEPTTMRLIDGHADH